MTKSGIVLVVGGVTNGCFINLDHYIVFSFFFSPHCTTATTATTGCVLFIEPILNFFRQTQCHRLRSTWYLVPNRFSIFLFFHCLHCLRIVQHDHNNNERFLLCRWKLAWITFWPWFHQQLQFLNSFSTVCHCQSDSGLIGRVGDIE